MIIFKNTLCYEFLLGYLISTIFNHLPIIIECLNIFSIIMQITCILFSQMRITPDGKQNSISFYFYNKMILSSQLSGNANYRFFLILFTGEQINQFSLLYFILELSVDYLGIH